MKSLFWKEWRENRAVIPMSAVLLVALFAILTFCCRYQDGIRQPMTVPFSDYAPLQFLFWVIPAALTTAGIVASEVSSGSFVFLCSLPLSRGRIWWLKIAVAYLVILLSILVCRVLFIGLYLIMTIQGYVDPAAVNTGALIGDFVIYPLLFSTGVFAVGTVATVVVPKTLSALVVIAVASAIILCLIIGAANLINISGVASVWVQLGLLLVAFFYLMQASRRIFVNGEDLKSIKRFKLLYAPGMVDIVAIVVALFIAFYWIIS